MELCNDCNVFSTILHTFSCCFSGIVFYNSTRIQTEGEIRLTLLKEKNLIPVQATLRTDLKV